MAKQMDGYISRATLRNVRVSPRRARLVVDMVRGKKVEDAIGILEFANKKTAPMLKKLLMSAVANAREQSSVDIDELMIKSAWVDEGRTLKRFIPRAHGRATPILKRHSHITVVLDELGTA